jgi:hypothetical protein
MVQGKYLSFKAFAAVGLGCLMLASVQHKVLQLSHLQTARSFVSTRAMSSDAGYTYKLRPAPSCLYLVIMDPINVPRSHRWPRPALTVDAVIVAKPQATTGSKLLLIQRKHPPCQVRPPLPPVEELRICISLVSINNTLLLDRDNGLCQEGLWMRMNP